MSERLVCDLCGARPLLGGDGDGVEGVEGYLPESDCPACDDGVLFYEDELDADEYDDDDMDCVCCDLDDDCCACPACEDLDGDDFDEDEDDDELLDDDE